MGQSPIAYATGLNSAKDKGKGKDISKSVTALADYQFSFINSLPLPSSFIDKTSSATISRTGQQIAIENESVKIHPFFSRQRDKSISSSSTHSISSNYTHISDDGFSEIGSEGKYLGLSRVAVSWVKRCSNVLIHNSNRDWRDFFKQKTNRWGLRTRKPNK